MSLTSFETKKLSHFFFKSFSFLRMSIYCFNVFWVVAVLIMFSGIKWWSNFCSLVLTIADDLFKILLGSNTSTFRITTETKEHLWNIFFTSTMINWAASFLISFTSLILTKSFLKRSFISHSPTKSEMFVFYKTFLSEKSNLVKCKPFKLLRMSSWK